MSKILVLLLSVTTLFMLSSCSKSESPVNHTVEGVWVGKYGYGNSTPDVYYSFNIKAGGLIEELTSSGQIKGTGTWKLENGIFSAKYYYLPPSTSSYSVIGAFEPAKNQILGNWGFKSSVTDGGLWDMKRTK